MKRKVLVFSEILVAIFTVVLLVTCDDKVEDDLQAVKTEQPELIGLQNNPTLDEIHEATVCVKEFAPRAFLKTVEVVEESTLEPSSLEAVLHVGESVTEQKLATVSPTPPQGDILFSFDLTGSMGDELENVKANSTNIMGEIAGIISDSHFGLISHMDYVGWFNSCNYYTQYGSSYYGDYPYSLDIPLTSGTADVSLEIASLELGSGSDYPEDYTRALYETTADVSIGWREGSRKIVVAWLDDIPHDCDVYSIIDGSGSTGADPGRDNMVGTEDDLEILDVLQAMADQNITLIVLNSGQYQTLWEAYAGITGGTAFQINGDGTIPGDIEIAPFIAGIIADEVSTIDELTLEVCTEGFEDWLVSVDPASYMDINLSEVNGFGFDIEIMVPEGTADGIYEFDICLVGDGAIYATQHVVITVESSSSLEVPFDVHPTSCPNPINRKSKGVIPAAILGTAAFDVSQIDPTTILLNGIVAPVRWAIDDVATPYEPFIDKDLNMNSCNTLGADGYDDLTMKFDASEVVETLLADYEMGDVVKFTITGESLDGAAFTGEDIIIIIK